MQRDKKPAPRPLFAPSLEDIERFAHRAMMSLPSELRRMAEDVVVKVEDFPDDDIMEIMNLESPFDLLGLYQGVDLPSRSIQDTGRLPDVVHLYRRPMLDYWCENDDPLEAIVRNVLIHEIGHHFGFSDEDMEALEEEED